MHYLLVLNHQFVQQRKDKFLRLLHQIIHLQMIEILQVYQTITYEDKNTKKNELLFCLRVWHSLLNGYFSFAFVT